MLKPAPNKKDVIVRDMEIFKQVIAETMVASGYRVGETFLEVSKGFERGWIVEFRFEVER